MTPLRSRRPVACAAAATALVVLAGCATRRPPDATTCTVAGDPVHVLAALREDVLARGWRIVDERADAFTADLGVSLRDIDVPPPGALPGSGATRRRTEVHSAATFVVAGGGSSSRVTLVSASSWWHPDRRAWLRGPAGELPGLEILTRAAGGQ